MGEEVTIGAEPRPKPADQREVSRSQELVVGGVLRKPGGYRSGRQYTKINGDAVFIFAGTLSPARTTLTGSSLPTLGRGKGKKKGPGGASATAVAAGPLHQSHPLAQVEERKEQKEISKGQREQSRGRGVKGKGKRHREESNIQC